VKKRIVLFMIFLLLLINVFSDEENIYQKSAYEYDNIFAVNENNEFKILGNMEIENKNIIFANYVNIWGDSKRASWKFMLFLENGIFLGMYTGIVFDIESIIINDQMIIFPFDSKDGNIIDFSNGIPDRVWIDGYLYEYLEINKPNKEINSRLFLIICIIILFFVILIIIILVYLRTRKKNISFYRK